MKKIQNPSKGKSKNQINKIKSKLFELRRKRFMDSKRGEILAF